MVHALHKIDELEVSYEPTKQTGYNAVYIFLGPRLTFGWELMKRQIWSLVSGLLAGSSNIFSVNLEFVQFFSFNLVEGKVQDLSGQLSFFANHT